MKIFLIIALVFYCITTLFIFFYTLLQFHLTLAYIKFKKKKKSLATSPILSSENIYVTVQLPLYNEPYVTERLINAVCALDYPKHLLEIQVLESQVYSQPSPQWNFLQATSFALAVQFR